jgi:hypothetical protein
VVAVAGDPAARRGNHRGAVKAKAGEDCEAPHAWTWHSVFTKRSSFAVAQATSSSLGLASTTARQRARETATFSRSRLNRKSTPRGMSAAAEVRAAATEAVAAFQQFSAAGLVAAASDRHLVTHAQRHLAEGAA